MQYLSRKDGDKLAYCHRKPAKNQPTVVFFGGYRSDMTGTKASFLDELCAKHGYGCLRFDYRGHGASDGDFASLVLSDWLDDALMIVDTLTTDKILLVGSSMGGWLGLLVARLRPERLSGFIGIAAAPDFTDWVWHEQMNDAMRESCRTDGYINTPDGDYLTLKLFQDGEKHRLLDKELSFPFPVTLLQGREDPEVPVAIAQKLHARITSTPTELIIIDDGDHRLSRPQDLERLGKVVQKLILAQNNP